MSVGVVSPSLRPPTDRYVQFVFVFVFVVVGGGWVAGEGAAPQTH